MSLFVNVKMDLNGLRVADNSSIGSTNKLKPNENRKRKVNRYEKIFD